MIIPLCSRVVRCVLLHHLHEHLHGSSHGVVFTSHDIVYASGRTLAVVFFFFDKISRGLEHSREKQFIYSRCTFDNLTTIVMRSKNTNKGKYKAADPIRRTLPTKCNIIRFLWRLCCIIQVPLAPHTADITRSGSLTKPPAPPNIFQCIFHQCLVHNIVACIFYIILVHSHFTAD
jgi:hypothetical protein